MKTFLEPADAELLEANALARDREGHMVPCLRDRLLIRLLFRCGLRVSEAVAIGVDDIDLARAELRVPHLKERVLLYCRECGVRLARSHRFCPGCQRPVSEAERRVQESRRQRLLPLDPDTVELLRDFIERGGPVLKNDRLMVFGISSMRAWQIVRDAARRAGLPPLVNPETGKTRGISPHRLRDAFATHAAAVDGSLEGIRLLQEQLGHKGMSTTMKYVKIAGEQQREWFDRLWQRQEEK